MQILNCSSRITLFSLSTTVCLANVDNPIVQPGSEPEFLPKDFVKIEVKVISPI